MKLNNTGINQKIKTEINFEKISPIFRNAENEGRNSLYEHEVYELLKCSGIFDTPEFMLLKKDDELSNEELQSFPGERVVLKIVSTGMTHKTEPGGVRFVDKEPEKIRAATLGMISEIPGKYASMLEEGLLTDEAYKNLSGEKLKEAVIKDIEGVLMVEYVPPGMASFGSELLAGIRNTREFGMIISAGPGGTDTELFAENFKKGRAFVASSAEMVSASDFLSLFRNTVSYRKLAGLTRGQKPLVTDNQLRECFSFLIELANYYSLSNPKAPYIIDELEINPFCFMDSRMFPLDGLCKFRMPKEIPAERPWSKIHNLLHPESIGIMGVSTKRMNFGRIILNNILAMGYDKKNICIIRPGIDSFEGVRCVPGLENIDIKLDLLVVALGSEQVLPVIEKVTDGQICESAILISSGMGETKESEEIAGRINDLIRKGHKREDRGPVFLGANCLGVISKPGRYDTLFIPDEKLSKQKVNERGNMAFVSQSGAFMITRLSKKPGLNPAYLISVGNQNDLTLGDMISYLKDRDDIDVIAVYAEGFKDLDGLNFIKAVKQAVRLGKDVIFYKAGKTREGKNATGSHTASIAGDYLVCESCVRQAGGIVASSFDQFGDLLVLSSRLKKKKIKGNRLAAISGAGFEAVGMADSINSGEFQLAMAEPSGTTLKRLNKLLVDKGLSHVTAVNNPLDLNPAGDDEAHMLALKYFAEDKNVDVLVIGLDPLSPSTSTLDGPEGGKFDFNRNGSIVLEFPELVNKLEKPVIGVVDGGCLFDPMVDKLVKRNMIIFRSADRAVSALALYIGGRLSADKII